MNIEELTSKIVEAAKNRESYHCDSQEYEKANEKVNKLIFSI